MCLKLQNSFFLINVKVQVGMLLGDVVICGKKQKILHYTCQELSYISGKRKNINT